MQQHTEIPDPEQDARHPRTGSDPARFGTRLPKVVYEPHKEQGQYDYCSQKEPAAEPTEQKASPSQRRRLDESLDSQS